MQVESPHNSLMEDFESYYPLVPKPFGEHLIAFRKSAGLTQYDLAAKLGVSQSNISFWERGDKPPRGEILPQLAETLGVTTDELLGRTPAKRPPSPALPGGRVRESFVAVAKLPRRQQEHILRVVDAFVAQQQKAG